MFPQVPLGREGDFAEAALSDRFLFVLVVTAYFSDVLFKMRQSSEQASALVTLKWTQVIMSGPDVHRHCGVVAERHTAPTSVKIIRWLTTESIRR